MSYAFPNRDDGGAWIADAKTRDPQHSRYPRPVPEPVPLDPCGISARLEAHRAANVRRLKKRDILFRFKPKSHISARELSLILAMTPLLRDPMAFYDLEESKKKLGSAFRHFDRVDP